MENLSDYLVKNPKQIEIYLNRLATEKCIIAASFGDNTSFLTAILNVDEKDQRLTIDCGPKEYLNKALLSIGIVNLKADFAGIKVLFEGRNIKKAGSSEKMALSVKIPEQLYWVQRRLVYRMRSPLSKDSYCKISLTNTEKHQESINLKLYDLSIKGFAFLCDTADTADQFAPNAEFKNCTLVLENEGIHTVSFVIRSKSPLNPIKPNKNQRIGCEFSHVSIQAESAFLRYMQKIEREIKRNQK